MGIKVCAYAICKNEVKYVSKWLDMMSEADYICVLDTGSTDGTYEALKADPRVTVVKQETIRPWRFDVARNKSMELAPEDTDVFFSMDFDEVVNKGWANVIRETFTAHPEINRIAYEYAWSHNDAGEPTDVFIYDKIHRRDHHWKFPVHEVLWPNEGVHEVFANVGYSIFVEHFRDMSKTRSNYLPLLQLSLEENPEDSHVSMMLAREYLLAQDFDNALKHYLYTLTLPDINAPEKRLVHLECLGRCADLYRMTKDYPKAIDYCNQFLALDTTYREPYFVLATCYSEMGIYPLTLALAEAGVANGIRKTDWVERADSWTYAYDDLVSVAYMNTGRYDEGIKHCLEALKHCPNDVRILRNYAFAMENRLKQTMQRINELEAK